MTPKLYKASDVCEATGLQPYVLRSWEKEFPGIGVQKSQDAPRLYRQSDLEQVLRIKQLVFGEGLTLAGARRRLEEETPRSADQADPEIAELLDTLGADARSRIDLVRRGLRSILDVLSKRAGTAALAALPSNGGRADRRAGSAARRKVATKPASRRSRPKHAAAAPKRGTAKARSGKRKRASA